MTCQVTSGSKYMSLSEKTDTAPVGHCTTDLSDLLTRGLEKVGIGCLKNPPLNLRNL